MERYIIKPSDLIVANREKNKLYEIYGQDFVNHINEICEELTNILNNSDVFSLMINKCLYDKNYRSTALEEISKLFVGNSLSDVYKSMTKKLINKYIYRILVSYIVSKEPAISNCEGVKDIPECDFIIERYHQFVDSLNVDATPSVPTIDENGCVVINKGDLFHGTKYSESVIDSIANKGLESGQLHGKVEDGESFFCIDFFKAANDSTPDQICATGKPFTNGANQIVFVISNLDIEGENALFPNLTDYDAYNENTEKGKQAREIVNVSGLPLNHSIAAAILMGVPPCMISSIIVNSEIESDPQKIEYLSTSFPKATIVSRTNGMVIKSPDIGYNR